MKLKTSPQRQSARPLSAPVSGAQVKSANRFSKKKTAAVLKRGGQCLESHGADYCND